MAPTCRQTCWARLLWVSSAKAALLTAILASTVAAEDEDDGQLHDGPPLLEGEYLHVNYRFDLNRANMKRQGSGELWFSFKDGLPRFRLRGAARSPRFGDGEITIVADAATELMYAYFRLGELHKEQCLKYPFPNPEHESNRKRLERLHYRKDQVHKWEMKESHSYDEDGNRLLPLHWSSKYILEFLVPNHKSVRGIVLREGSRIVKSVRLEGKPYSSKTTPEDTKFVFGPPSSNCTLVNDAFDPMATVELTPPHQKSSALKDLLLVLADRSLNHHWPRTFVILSALTVPGDVSVMIEDPPPPHPERLGGVSFDYSSTVYNRGVRHTSDGSIWLNLAERAFRLRGEAKKTKVGPLMMDVVARGGDVNKVYANVNLTVQEEHECVVYEYPTLNQMNIQALKDVEGQGLSFFTIAELGDEDCGIFVAPLARDRWIHLWVDMESDTPDIILRSEIHKGGQVLRSTDVLRWRASDKVGSSAPVTPKESWNCEEESGPRQLAHLGLKEIHKHSIQLQDALYALRNLRLEFALLEVLGLTGDVAIMVQEPELPELWRLPAVSFSFTLYLGTSNALHTYMGSLAADLQHGRIRLTAGATTAKATNVSVSLEPGFLAVKVKDAHKADLDDGGSSCLYLDYDNGPSRGGSTQQPLAAAGIFDGVEAIGKRECNRFTFLGTGAHAESVQFWFSQEDDAVCQLEVLPPENNPDNLVGALIHIPAYEVSYSPMTESLAEAPKGWDCVQAGSKNADVDTTWLKLASEPVQSSLPAGTALAKLAEAAGVVGILPPRIANTLARIVVSAPGGQEKPKPSEAPSEPPMDIFDPKLETFSFSFFSTLGQGLLYSPQRGTAETAAEGTHGEGNLYVDLARRRLFLLSRATNVSAGVPQVESRVIFRGDRGRLYVRNEIKSEHFEQCWSVNTADTLPDPPSGVRKNPFIQGNSKRDIQGFSLPGAAGDHADKYIIKLDKKKRVEIFVDKNKALAGINLNDVSRGISAGIRVRNWTTAHLDDSWFEPDESIWKCHDIEFQEDAEHLLHWDLIRVFFPPSGVYAQHPEQPLTGRRLDWV